MAENNNSVFLTDLCTYSLFFLVKGCIYKHGYIFLILLLTSPVIKYRGIDKTVRLTNDQKAVQKHTGHGNLIPYYDNGEAFYIKSQTARQLCVQYSAILFLCIVYSFDKTWYLKFRNDFAMILVHLTFLNFASICWIKTLANEIIPSKEHTNSKSCKRKSSEGTPALEKNIQPGDSEQKDDDNSTPPEKRGRKQMIHSGEVCGPCSVWEQLGRDPHYADAHSMKTPRHAGNLCEQFCTFLSVKNQSFSLKEDSCLCNACFVDAKRNLISADKEPRWVGIHIPPAKVQNHCPVCHNDLEGGNELCPCLDTTRWYQSSSWTCGLKIDVWRQYFEITRKRFYATLKPSSVLCIRHYLEIYHHFKSRQCKYCNTKMTDTWGFVGSLKSTISRIVPQDHANTLSESDWLCISCNKSIQNKMKPRKIQTTNNDIIQKLMEQILQINLEKVKQMGYIHRKNMLDEFRSAVTGLPSKPDDAEFKFDNFITYKIKKRSDLGYFSGKSKLTNVIIYDKEKLSEHAVSVIHDLEKKSEKLQRKLDTLEQNSVTTEKELQKMIEEQIKLFKTATEPFDYRKMFDLIDKNCEIQDNYFLQKYLHAPLVSFFERVLGIAKCDSATGHQPKQRLKLQMVIALLCNIQNKSVIMMQTVVGLVAYACGLRDKGFSILNKFGVICSINHIRREASKWSDMRKCSDEIDKAAFWRISFDNLNFKRKFAKTFQTTGQVLGRILNLLTGQVSHQIQDYDSSKKYQTEAPMNGTETPEFTITEYHFFCQAPSPERSAWQEFQSAVFKSTKTVLGQSPLDLKSTLFERLQNHCPHFTPSIPDNIVYATVKEAQSSSIDDVASYLTELKVDLCIGKEGFPNKAVLGGDQQTYAILKNLIKKYPSTFSWIIPVPGDWHLLKCAAETIKDMLWDGGMSDLCKEVKHMNL